MTMWRKTIIFFAVANLFCVADAFEDFDGFQYMNFSVHPCEDFYEYTCGNFKNFHPLRNEQEVVDQYYFLEENLTALVNEILQDELRDDEPDALKKAKMAYQACVDEDFEYSWDMKTPEALIIEKYKGFPILDATYSGSADAFNWNDIADIAAEHGIEVFLSVTLFADTVDPSRNILRILSDSMEQPSFRPYKPPTYDDAIEEGFQHFANGGRLRTSAQSPMETLVKKIVTKLKNDLRSNVADEEIDKRVDMITNFIKGFYSDRIIPNDTNIEPIGNDTSVYTLKDLNAWTKKQFGNTIQLDWVEYVKRLVKYTYVNIDENTPVYNDPIKRLYGVLDWVRQNEPAIVKSTALLRAFLYLAYDSDPQTRNYFEEYLVSSGKTVYPRWEYCTKKIMDVTGSIALSLAVAYAFQLKHVSNSTLENAMDMVTNLHATFTETIKEVDWMDDETKAIALQKSNKLMTLLGYPHLVKDPDLLDDFYKDLPMTTWDHYNNSKILRAFKQSYSLSMLSKRDRASWDKSPFDVNAYYNRQNNKIIFPVAVLNPIFFGAKKRFLDYSRIGMVIGHEITHGYDMNGFIFDPDGVLKYWWSNQTRNNFDKKIKCFTDQYAKYFIPEINSTLDSNKSLNENLADNGGLGTAYKTYRKVFADENFAEGSHFTQDQLFFIGYGSMWCSTESNAYLESLIKACSETSNCHSRAKWRVNGVVSNMEEFSAAFNCPARSPMNPETKCKLW